MSERSTSHPARVLVVDDDPVCRLFCHHAFRGRSWEVLAAASARAAIELACAVRPALIIMDLHLGEDHGQSALEAIRKDWPRDLAAPVFIATTGDATALIQASPQSLGFAKVLQKPFTARDLLSLADRMLPSLGQECGPGVRCSAAMTQLLEQALRDEWGAGLDELDEHISALDWTRARVTLHRLQGAAAFAGRPELAECARQLTHAITTAPVGADMASTYLHFLWMGAMFTQRALAAPVTSMPHESIQPFP